MARSVQVPGSGTLVAGAASITPKSVPATRVAPEEGRRVRDKVGSATKVPVGPFAKPNVVGVRVAVNRACAKTVLDEN